MFPVNSITLKQATWLVEDLTGQHLAEVSLRAACARGALKGKKIGKVWYVTEEDLVEYLDNRPEHFQYPFKRDIYRNSIRTATWGDWEPDRVKLKQ